MKQIRFIVSCGGMYTARVYAPLEEARTVALEVMPDSQFTIVEVNA